MRTHRTPVLTVAISIGALMAMVRGHPAVVTPMAYVSWRCRWYASPTSRALKSSTPRAGLALAIHPRRERSPEF